MRICFTFFVGRTRVIRVFPIALLHRAHMYCSWRLTGAMLHQVRTGTARPPMNAGQRNERQGRGGNRASPYLTRQHHCLFPHCPHQDRQAHWHCSVPAVCCGNRRRCGIGSVRALCHHAAGAALRYVGAGTDHRPRRIRHGSWLEPGRLHAGARHPERAARPLCLPSGALSYAREQR